jgi:hypothetical protein
VFNEAITAADAARDWTGIQVAVWFVAIGTVVGVSILCFLMKALFRLLPMLTSIAKNVTDSREDSKELKRVIGHLLDCPRPTHQCPIKSARAGTQYRRESANSLLADAWRAAREPAVKEKLSALHRELFPGPASEE